MNKQDLISSVADQSGLSKSDAGKAVPAAPDAEARRDSRAHIERQDEAPVISLNARRREPVDPLEDEMATSGVAVAAAGVAMAAMMQSRNRRASWRVRGLASRRRRWDGRGARPAEAGRLDSAAVECLQPPTLANLGGFPPFPDSTGEGAPAGPEDTARTPCYPARHSR